MNSKIESDFNMAGMDTISFYEEFFQEFEIKNPEDFNLNEYVTSENLEIGLMLKSIFSRSARQSLKVKEVSVAHLVKVAEAKYWSEE